MEYRSAHILKGLVEEYTRTAKPVGSMRLCELLDVEVSPATMRNILRELEEEGYVVQPHTSAGRIPTDKGYRYYVDNLTFRSRSDGQMQQLAGRLSRYQEEYERPARATAKLLAELARSIAVSGYLSTRDIQEAGLATLFADEGEDTQDAAREASNFLDNIDQHIEDLAQHADGAVQIYIGQENPVRQSQHTSLLVRAAKLPTGERAVLLIVGPKRMQYRRNVSLLDSVASIIEHM
ncbi:MAG: hypothetical protein WD200_04510 [Candidatus Andersenbacteria bacterium]